MFLAEVQWFFTSVNACLKITISCLKIMFFAEVQWFFIHSVSNFACLKQRGHFRNFKHAVFNSCVKIHVLDTFLNVFKRV